MKFPKPKHLLKNEFPDLEINEPTLYQKVIKEIVYPEPRSARDRYITNTIKLLKERAKHKAITAKINQIFMCMLSQITALR
jgi:hypothetical protein